MSTGQDVPLSSLFPPPNIDTAQLPYDEDDDNDEDADNIRDTTVVPHENVDGRH